jgi:hypothetical protein
MNNFYVTLLSNSSMEYYPNNTTSHFTVQLPKTITLEGKWVVAATDIYYQFNFLNVSEGNCRLTFNYKGDEGQCDIPEGYYGSIDNILDVLNAYMDAFVTGGHFLVLNKRKQVIVNENAFSALKNIRFSNRLALQLGFEPNTDLVYEYQSTALPASISKGVPDEIFVYCSIIEPQYFGHELTNILRIVNIPKNDEICFGQTFHKEYQRLQYIPVMKKCFETITIDLRDKTGEFLPFTSGTVMIVLHFKKID